MNLWWLGSWFEIQQIIQLSLWPRFEDFRNYSRCQVKNNKKRLAHSDRLLAHQFEALLSVIVVRARDTIFAKKCQEVQRHILRHPKERYGVWAQVHRYVFITEDPEIVPRNVLSTNSGS